jgi:RNA polymerase sigma-B factor
MTTAAARPGTGMAHEGTPLSGLDAAELRELFQRAHRGDTAAREKLVDQYLALARRLARRYHRSSEPFDDLVQVANLGLLKAIDRFDPSRGVAFTSFAVPTILGELKRHFRDTGWAVHVPRALHERALRVDTTQRLLEGRLGRSPDMHEIAAELGLGLEDVLDAMQASGAYEALSIDAPGHSDEGDHDGLVESLGQEDSGIELAEERATVAATIKRLPVRDRQVLELRFGGDMTQTEIAKRIGVSQMQVSRIIRRALERLREMADEAEPAPSAPAVGDGRPGSAPSD